MHDNNGSPGGKGKGCFGEPRAAAAAPSSPSVAVHLIAGARGQQGAAAPWHPTLRPLHPARHPLMLQDPSPRQLQPACRLPSRISWGTGRCVLPESLKASAASRLNDSTQCRRLRLFFFYHTIKMYIQLCPVSLRKQILSSRNERAVLEPPTEFLYVFCILPVDFRFNRLNPCCDFNYHCLKPLFGETFSYFCAFIKVDCL